MRQPDVHVGNPVVRGALTVFPVFNGAAVEAPGYELYGPGVMVAERAGAPVLDEVVVTNPGPVAILVRAKELLEGGWQHRVVARSAVVEARQAAVLEVRGVEQRRWEGGGVHARCGRTAPVYVSAAKGQPDVWDRVYRYGASHTGSLLETMQAVESAAAGLVRDLRPLPFQSGVLIGIDGWPVLLEVFDSPGTLAQAWDGLLHAAAADAVGKPPVATPGRRARRFARQVREVPLRHGRGATDDVRVSVLAWSGRAVHTVAVNRRHHLVSA